MLTLHVQNLRVLRLVRWQLSGVSVLTGANGAGKTTALLALRTIRAAFRGGLPEAVSNSLGGSYGLRNRAADADEPVELGLDVGDVSWRVRLTPRAATVDHVTDERLTQGAETIFVRDGLGNFFYRGERKELSPAAAEHLGLRWVAETYPDDRAAAELASAVERMQVFYNPDLRGLREGGSRATDDRHLQANGRNVFTMLRKWRDRREDRPRFEFVHAGLRAAFPGVYQDLDFVTGQTISANVFRPGDETPTPVSHEANGFLSMLVALAQVASTEDGGLVAIDEPENSLHPYAIRRFVRLSREFARQRGLTIVLTTHSPVLLDEFNGEPNRVFVLDRAEMQKGTPLPVPLDELRDREWLANYTLGELYTGGEFAANEPG
jgi:predicted ATPase